jgi:hypothetical protein
LFRQKPRVNLTRSDCVQPLRPFIYAGLRAEPLVFAGVWQTGSRGDYAGIKRLAGPGLWKPGAVKDQTPLQILTIRQMLQRVAFIMPTV